MQIFESRIPGCLNFEFSLHGIRTHEERNHKRSSERMRKEAMIRDCDGGVVPPALSGTGRRVHIDRAVKRLEQADNELSRGPSVDNGHEANDIQAMLAPPNETNDNVYLFEPNEKQKDPLHLLSDAFTKAAIQLGERNCNNLLWTMRSLSDMLSTCV